jgi:cytochrome P450
LCLSSSSALNFSIILFLSTTLSTYFNFHDLCRYTWQVLEETLRCSVTAPFAARVSPDRDLRVHGHLIPANTPIVCALGVALNDPNVFQDPGK